MLGWWQRLKQKIFRDQLALLLKDLDDNKGFVFAVEGKIVHCHLCRKHTKLPPVKIPLRLEPDSDAPTVKGNPVAFEAVYTHFHFSCAVKYLLTNPGVESFTTDTENKHG